MADIQAHLVVDTDYLPTLLQLLAGAQRRVDLIAYSFSIGSAKRTAPAANATLQVANALIAARARGVVVRMYIEAHRETAERNRPTGELLAAAGVDVHYGRTHAKGFLIDDRVLFGSTNLSNQSLTKNIETNLLFDDARVRAGFERYFAHLWNGGRHGGIELELPMIADGDFQPVLIEMVDAAEEQIDFSIYFFDDDDIADAMIRAHRRGVRVRGLVHTHRSFAMSYVMRTQRSVDRLLAGGVTDLHFGPPTLFTHSKFLVRDRDELLLGTGNWLLEDVEIHPQLYVRFTNAPLGVELVDHLDATIAARATAVTATMRR